MPTDFGLGLNNFTDDESFLGATALSQKNYDPSGKAVELKTSLSQDPAPNKTLTTYNVSDVMQGGATVRPVDLSYNSFNEMLTRDLGSLRNSTINGKKVSFGPSLGQLVAYDAKGPGFDFGSGSDSLGSSSGASGNTPSGTPYTGRAGECPPGIRRGPFPLRIMRPITGVPAWDPDGGGVAPEQLTEEEIYQLILAAGWDIQDAWQMWGICVMRESNMICNAAGYDSPPNVTGMGVGLMQITMKFPDVPPWEGGPSPGNVPGTDQPWTAANMTDPWLNILTAKGMFDQRQFGPWNMSGYWGSTDGSHVRGWDVERAKNFFRAHGHEIA